MIPYWKLPSMPWVDNPPQELKAGVDKYSHNRNGHRKGHAEPICKRCRVQKIRGKCRNLECAKREGKP